ncbi:hypothetical protein Tco_0462567 [Tanacetum coccineum]
MICLFFSHAVMSVFALSLVNPLATLLVSVPLVVLEQMKVFNLVVKTALEPYGTSVWLCFFLNIELGTDLQNSFSGRYFEILSGGSMYSVCDLTATRSEGSSVFVDGSGISFLLNTPVSDAL